MPRATVMRLFVGSILAVVAGTIVGFAAVIAGYAGGAFVMDGPDVVGIHGTAASWTMIAVLVIGLLAIVAGAVAGLVSWIGALLNTAQLPDKTWFVVLLVLGIWNLGFIAMLAYAVAGPDERLVGSVPATQAEIAASRS